MDYPLYYFYLYCIWMIYNDYLNNNFKYSTHRKVLDTVIFIRPIF